MSRPLVSLAARRSLQRTVFAASIASCSLLIATQANAQSATRPVWEPAVAPMTSALPRSAPSMRARFGVGQWIDRLNASDASIRAAAVRSLARYTPRGPAQDEVVEQLAERLRSETDAAVQSAMIEALAGLAQERAVPALVPIVTMRGALAPAAAQQALAFVGPLLDRDGIDAVLNGLVGAAFSATESLRLAALDALAASPDEPFSDRVAIHRANPARLAILLEAIGRRGDGRWGSAVLEQLQSTQRAVQLAAVRAASSLRLLEAATWLSRIVRERTLDTELQVTAIQGLAVVGAGDPEATQAALRAALATPALANDTRRTIATLGIRALASDVARGLDAPWRVDRRAVAEALGDIGGTDAARALITALSNERDEVARRVLWRAAVRADETSARRALEAAEESDRAARWTALEMLLRRQALPRMRALHTLATQGDVAAMSIECASGDCRAALTRLREASVERRSDGAWALTFARAIDAPAILRLFEAEQDSATRLLFAFALMRSDSTLVTRSFERVALQSTETVSAEQAVLAELAARRGSSEVRRLLPAMLADQRAVVRALALWIAARTGDNVARGAAERVSLSDPSPDVRSVAAAVLATARNGAVIATGSSVLHAAGLTPRTSWVAWLPQGQLVVAMASGDGTLLVPFVPGGPFDVESLL